MLVAGHQDEAPPTSDGSAGAHAGMPEESRTEPRQVGAASNKRHRLYIMESNVTTAIRPKDLEAISGKWRCTIVATTMLAIIASFVWLCVYKFT